MGYLALYTKHHPEGSSISATGPYNKDSHNSEHAREKIDEFHMREFFPEDSFLHICHSSPLL